MTGKLVVPPGAALDEVAQALLAEEALGQQPRVYVPDLWHKLGDEARAEVADHRFDLLRQARPGPSG